MADTGVFIPVVDFKDHVMRLHLNDDLPFSKEYEALVSNYTCYGDDIYCLLCSMKKQVMFPPLKLPTTISMRLRTDMPTYLLVSICNNVIIIIKV